MLHVEFILICGETDKYVFCVCQRIPKMIQKQNIVKAILTNIIIFHLFLFRAKNNQIHKCTEAEIEIFGKIKALK